MSSLFDCVHEKTAPSPITPSPLFLPPYPFTPKSEMNVFFIVKLDDRGNDASDVKHASNFVFLHLLTYIAQKRSFGNYFQWLIQWYLELHVCSFIWTKSVIMMMTLIANLEIVSNLITLKLEMLKNHNQNDTNDDITYLKKIMID